MRRFRISGVPIVDGAGRLIGIITNRDLQFESNLERPIAEAMTREGLITTPVGTTLAAAEAILAHHKIEKLPVVDDAGVLKGLITVKDIFKRRDFPDANKDTHGRLRAAAAVGAGAEAKVRARALVTAGVDVVIVVDSAHGPFGRRARDDCRPARRLSRRATRRWQHCDRGRCPGAGRTWRRCGEGRHRTGIDLHDARVVTGVGVAAQLHGDH